MEWITKKLIQFVLSLLDTWGSSKLTLERGRQRRAWIESNVIDRVNRLEKKNKSWMKFKIDNGFVQYMIGLMKSNRLTEFRDGD